MGRKQKKLTKKKKRSRAQDPSVTVVEHAKVNSVAEHVELNVEHASVDVEDAAVDVEDVPEAETKISTSTPLLEEIITEDGILGYITSTLPLREAVRTCVLSKRWRHIWTHKKKLNFDTNTMFDAHFLSTLNRDNSHLTARERYELLLEKRLLLDGKTDQFIQSVYSVLRQYPDARLDEVMIQYCLHKVHSHHLDSWVRFAASNSKRLVLDLDQQHVKFRIEPYDFPCQLLGTSSSIEKLSLISCSLRLTKIDGFMYLKVLTLYDIDITEDDIHHLLSNCLVLQKLGLWKSRQLVSLNISSPLSQLHYLLVSECDYLREIKINAVNLNTLHYKGVPIDFNFKQSLQLKDAEIYLKTNGSMPSLDCCLTKLSRKLPHLRSLTLDISSVPKVGSLPEGSNSFIHLKRVAVEWDAGFQLSLLHLATLLDASPFIEELKLLLLTRVEEPPPARLKRLRQKLRKHHHHHHHSHLKSIEISGFYFDKWQIEIALFLLKSTTELESLRIEQGRNPCPEIRETDIQNFSKQIPANTKFSFVIPR